MLVFQRLRSIYDVTNQSYSLADLDPFEMATEEESKVAVILPGQVSNYKYNISDVSGSCLPASKTSYTDKTSRQIQKYKIFYSSIVLLPPLVRV